MKIENEDRLKYDNTVKIVAVIFDKKRDEVEKRLKEKLIKKVHSNKKLLKNILEEFTRKEQTYPIMVKNFKRNEKKDKKRVLQQSLST